MNFLTEHQIEQYADLVSRIEEINAENEKTADALKNVEKRLADMAVLMKHVATYQKTKPVYEAYRKAKDKDAYRAKNESGLILQDVYKRQDLHPSGGLPKPYPLPATLLTLGLWL